jgi:hypothetical protein
MITVIGPCVVPEVDSYSHSLRCTLASTSAQSAKNAQWPRSTISRLVSSGISA